MTTITINPTIEPADPELLTAFRAASTASISDNLDRLQGAVGMTPYHLYSERMVGMAFTVRTRAGDNLALHAALAEIAPGYVLVVDGDGDPSRALFGDIMLNIAMERGVAGVVIDGAVRDLDAIGSQSRVPCFARAVCHRGPYKNGPGELNGTVSVGGMVVRAGDIVVGDRDGVVAFSRDLAPDLLRLVRAQELKEEGILFSIRNGSYRGAYGL